MVTTSAIATPVASAWPINTPERILSALAGRDGATAEEISNESNIALSIVIEWLSEKARQGLLLFNPFKNTYSSLCAWPSVATATQRAR